MTLQALFGQEAPRLLRTGWGERIWELTGIDEKSGKPRYRPRDTGVQPLAEEVYAILMSRKPIETWQPFTIVNHGDGPAINVVNTNPESPGIAVYNIINNPPAAGDNITNLGDLYDNSVTMNPGGLTINEGSTAVTISPTIINQITNQTINQTFITIDGTPVGNDDPCNRVVRPFRMQSYVQEGNAGVGSLLVWSGSSWAPTGSTFPLSTDFFTGALLTNDLALAQWDCRSARFYLIGAGHTYFRGTLDSQLSSSGNAQMTITGSTQKITLKEVYGLHDPLSGSTKVGASWNKVLKQWEGTVATC